MKKFFALIFLISVFSLAVAAQTKGDPTFEQHHVKVENTRSKPVNLASNKKARMFRTNLREAAKGKVNFAGHCIIATWGCGTNCNDSGIIDTRTGRVFFPPQLEGVGVALASWSNDLEAIVYKPDSTLLVINGLPGGSQLDYKNPKQGIHYLLWNGTSFREIKFVKKSNDQ